MCLVICDVLLDAVPDSETQDIGSNKKPILVHLMILILPCRSAMRGSRYSVVAAMVLYLDVPLARYRYGP